MKKKNPNARHRGKLLVKSSGGKPSANNAIRTAIKPRTKLPSLSKTKKRILLVDDDPESLELFCAFLSEAGYQVDQAANALAAICAVIRHRPDLVLADIRMPIIDGAELARELKSHRDSRHIPVVALTGYDTPGMRESALQSGYDDYMTKPIDPRKFRAQVAKLLHQHKLKRSAESA
jgi:CheY-like chemotaxis protein